MYIFVIPITQYIKYSYIKIIIINTEEINFVLIYLVYFGFNIKISKINKYFKKGVFFPQTL